MTTAKRINAGPTKAFFVKMLTRDIELVYALKKNKDTIEIQGIFPLVRTDFNIMTGSSSILESFGGIILDDIVHVSFVCNFKKSGTKK